MTAFPTAFAKTISWVTANDLPDTAKPALDFVTQQGFHIQIGLLLSDMSELSRIVLQPSIREFCPKDATQRFKDIATATEWFKKGRLPLVLKDAKTNAIAGYGWFGPGLNDHVPGATLTGALRLNEQYQGRGLATPFLTVMVHYTLTYWPTETAWFETWESNAGAVHIYKKVGFETVDQKSEQRPTADGKTIDDVRLFMQLLSSSL